MQNNDHNRTTAVEYAAKDKIETMIVGAFKEAEKEKALIKKSNPPSATPALSSKLIRDAVLVMMLVSGITALAVTSTVLLITK